jgi:hypothetical protein
VATAVANTPEADLASCKVIKLLPSAPAALLEPTRAFLFNLAFPVKDDPEIAVTIGF